LGRNNQMQVRFSDMRISRMHATVIKNNKDIWIRDENSATGTFINNRRINGQVKLKHGDVIKIGTQEILEFRDK